MNLPNKLTIIRCVMTPIFMVAMLWNFPGHYVVALGLFIVASLTDMVDGKIARSRNLITNLGKFLDPLADKMLTTAAFLAIMTAFGAPAILCWAVMIILAREFMVTSVRLLAAKDGVVVAASMAGKLKTVLQMVAIIYTIAALHILSLDVTTRGVNFALVISAFVLIWVSVVFTVTSGIQYVWQLRHYFKEN